MPVIRKSKSCCPTARLEDTARHHRNKGRVYACLKLWVVSVSRPEGSLKRSAGTTRCRYIPTQAPGLRGLRVNHLPKNDGRRLVSETPPTPPPLDIAAALFQYVALAGKGADSPSGSKPVPDASRPSSASLDSVGSEGAWTHPYQAANFFRPSAKAGLRWSSTCGASPPFAPPPT